MPASKPPIRCRQIGADDLSAVTALLTRGFAYRGAQFWQHALDQLTRHEPPAGLPKYGYLLEAGGAAVGAILMICSTMPTGSTTGATVAPRCNLSSWYVDPAYRAYAPLLVSHALRHKEVTYLNVSAAPHTWPIIEAQGFSRYSEGIFIALPALNRGGGEVEIVDAKKQPASPYEPFEQDVLREHAEHGCISLWCATAERAHPFVFRPRFVKGVVPCAQLIYCRDIADFVRFAGPLGRHLAWRGRPIVIVDSNGTIPGLVGIFGRGSRPKYFKGPQRPRLGDLAYTEYAILGV